MNSYRLRARLVVTLAAILTVVAVPASPPAAAAAVPDQVRAWNKHAYNELIVTAGQAPPVAVLHLAMVHGAVYDAVNSIHGGYEPYLGSLPAPGGSSKDAAAAAAAYQVLLSILPAREAQLTEYYDASLALIPDGPAKSGGVLVGEAAASAMITERTGDGRSGTDVYEVGTNPGEWRPIPNPNGSPVVNAFRWVGLVDPFLIESAADFATVGPQALDSAEYAAEFDQVKALGGTTGSTRTADQTEQAVFWADHAVGMWTRIFRQLSRHADLSVVENARFFAMLYLTGADAAIACFEDKTKGFWRPQTAIQEAADDGNAATEADPTWTSLLQNPPYPDHPSGHNCVSSSFVRTLRDFFGTDEMSFRATRVFTQPGPAPITRTYTRFSQAIQEIRWARIYGGLHFWSADAQGGRLGRLVADYRDEHYFQPVP